MEMLAYCLFGLLIIGMVIWVILMGMALRGTSRIMFARRPIPPPVPEPKLET